MTSVSRWRPSQPAMHWNHAWKLGAAAVAIGLIRAAVATHTGMATFEQAGVSEA